MKKLSLLLALLILMSSLLLVACGEDDPQNPPENPETPGTETPETPIVEYDIAWVDENGTTIKTEKVKEGIVPSNTYTVTDTAEWDYTFEGWSLTSGGTVLSSIPTASADAKYYAVVSRVKVKYDVTFNMNGGPAVQAQSVEYGSCAEVPQAPEYEGHRFMGWFSDEDLTVPADFGAVVTENVTYYAKWNEFVDIGDYLETLLEGYDMNPYLYIPEPMRHAYSANLVATEDIITDYSSFVNVSDINMHGFGEQWNMILDNIFQSMTFYNVLSAVEGLASTSIAAFNNYIDKNPANTARHSFESGIYNVTIDFDGEIISYVLDYTATLPALGEQTVQIALSMDVESAERNVRIQLGDANALSYTVTENSYSFAIKYLGVRRAFFTVSRDENGDVQGHIYEYLVVSSVEVASAADFYITENYATAIGNKAGGMLGFTGYISETYDVTDGKMVAYEVEETLKSITYNTLWFDLDMFDGIESIKYRAATDDVPAAFFVNGSNTEWNDKKVGGLSLKTLSRRFDIEFRTQYFYSYDEANDQYVQIKTEVPMLFVQEENYETLFEDIEEVNGIELSALISSTDLSEVQSDYDTYIPVFITNKDLVTPELIVKAIGEKVVFATE